MTHKVYLEPTRNLEGGWYGIPPGGLVSDANRPIYWRVPEKDAFDLSRDDAVRVCMGARRMAYPARCVPPITITVTY